MTPDKTGYFFQLAREIAADLVANRIPDEELQRTLRPMGQYIVPGTDLPLSSVARGDYLIAMAASAGADRARAVVPIRVVR